MISAQFVSNISVGVGVSVGLSVGLFVGLGLSVGVAFSPVADFVTLGSGVEVCCSSCSFAANLELSSLNCFIRWL